MRLGVISDVHAGNMKSFGGHVEAGLNARCRLTCETIKRAVGKAWEHGCSGFYVLGDLTDSDRPSPQEVSAIIDALSYTADKPRHMQVTLLLGNHDMRSDAAGDHALGPFQRAGLDVVEKPLWDGLGNCDMIMVPFQPGDAREWLPAALEKLHQKPCDRAEMRVLCLHLGIYDSHTPPWLQSCKDAVPVPLLQTLMEGYKIDATLAGNWHSRRLWQEGLPQPHVGKKVGARDVILQLGTLAPTGFDDAPPFGTLAIVDTEKRDITIHEIPGPRFITVTDREPLLLPKDGNTYFLRVQSDVKNRDASSAMIQDAKARGHVADGRVDVDRTEIKAQAATAARNASSALSTEGAIDDYVRAMPIEDGVDRDAVIQLVKGYLR